MNRKYEKQKRIAQLLSANALPIVKSLFAFTIGRTFDDMKLAAEAGKGGTLMKQVPFITVEGPIGVGKTSLAKRITENFQFHFLGEIVEENPFLNKFYNNIEEWSFQTEMFFLCNRYKQLEDIQKKYLFQDTPVVADYHILKNLIFAERTLQKQQLEKYYRIYSVLTEDMPVPNVIIYLTASLETLQERIAMRGREFEKGISSDYLLQLIEDYQTTMKRFKETHPNVPVLTYNGDEIDFVSNKEQLQMILTDLHNILQKGSHNESS